MSTLSFKALPLGFALVLLSACATQSAYQSAEKPGGQGYSETRLTDTRYRVTFTGNSVTPAGTIQNAALLRAAELTLQKGYDWFQIADRQLDRQQRSNTTVSSGLDFPSQTTVYQRCGLLRCDATVVSSPGFSSGADLATTTTSTAYSSSLEIVMGKKPMPGSIESYDARQLMASLDNLKNPAKR